MFRTIVYNDTGPTEVKDPSEWSEALGREFKTSTHEHRVKIETLKTLIATYRHGAPPANADSAEEQKTVFQNALSSPPSLMASAKNEFCCFDAREHAGDDIDRCNLAIKRIWASGTISDHAAQAASSFAQKQRAALQKLLHVPSCYKRFAVWKEIANTSPDSMSSTVNSIEEEIRSIMTELDVIVASGNSQA